MDVNLNFTIFQDNVFSVQPEKKLSFKSVVFCEEGQVTKEKSIIKSLSNISKQLVTVCSVLNEKPIIQYQGSSHFAKGVATHLSKDLDFLWAQIAKHKKNGF